MKYINYELYGKQYELYVELNKYYNGNLAIHLMEKHGEPFVSLTVNLTELNDNTLAYIDENNFEDAEELIEKYKLGTFAGEYYTSGYCIYSLFKFDLNKLKEYTLQAKEGE